MALLGLVALNLLFLLAGSGVLWALRGWTDWGDWIGSSGIAYLLGVGVSGVLMTLVLVYGGGATTAAILAVTLGPAAAGTAVGVLRRRPLPRGVSLRLPRTKADVAAVALALGTAALLGAFFRQARVDPLRQWDAWSFWVPKAKVIYFFGGIDGPLFRTITGSSYPLLIPGLDAMDFRFMGAADTTLLAVQYWLLLVGFVGAMAGLLRSLAPAWLVWLFGMTVVVIPSLDARVLARLADWPLDFFFCLAALALARWLLRDETWALGAAGVFLAAEMATKREGQLLTACLVAGTLVTLGWSGRRRWPLPLALAAAAYAFNIPWRLWWTSRQLTPDTPEGVLGNTFRLGRVPGSFHLVLRLLFDYGLWNAVVPLALVAALLLVTYRERRAAVLYLATGCLGVVAWAWVNWSNPAYVLSTTDALNPTDRAVGSLVLLSAAFAPLLLAGVFRSSGRAPEA